MCDMLVDADNHYTATFKSLSIIHIARREVKDIIKQRLKTRLMEHARERDPSLSAEDIRQAITPVDLKRIDEQAEEESKIDLNKVVLRFQALESVVDHEGRKVWRPITPTVDSEPVVNLKNASTGELKIVRMSACSAPCEGGTEVWMLVEKVNRTKIKIKFFEEDESGAVVWSSYGVFSEGDVHHQYAIVFKTPPYRHMHLRSPVKVRVQLERANDNDTTDTSEPRDFTFYPKCRKRHSPHSDFSDAEEEECALAVSVGRAKRPRHGSTEPLDLRYGGGTARCPSDADIIGMLETYKEAPGSGAVPGSVSPYQTQYVLSPPDSSLDPHSPHSLSSPSPSYQAHSPNQMASPHYAGDSPHFYTASTTPSTTLSYLPDHQVPGSPPNSYTQPRVTSPMQPQQQQQQTTNSSIGAPQVYQNLTASPQNQQYLVPSNAVSPSLLQSNPLRQQYTSLSPQRGTTSLHSTTSALHNSGSSVQIQTLNNLDTSTYQNGNTAVQSNPSGFQNFTNLQNMGQTFQPGSANFQNNVSFGNLNQNLQQQQQNSASYESKGFVLENNSTAFGGSSWVTQPPRAANPLKVTLPQHHDLQLANNTLNTPIVEAPNLGDEMSGDYYSHLMMSPSFELPELTQLGCLGSGQFGDLQVDHVRVPKSRKSSSVDKLTAALARTSLEPSRSPLEPSAARPHAGAAKKPQGQQPTAVAVRLALAAASHLQAYSGASYLTHLTSAFTCLLKLQDSAGNSALHIAVQTQAAAGGAAQAAAQEALTKLVSLTAALGCPEASALQNLVGECPLHIAATLQLPRAADALLQLHAPPVTLQDERGDTPLHLALRRGGGATLAALLKPRPHAAAKKALRDALVTYNYDGNTPLHEAVARGQLTSVRHLVSTGEGVHLCEQKRGANPLHLAVLHGRPSIAAYLIQHTNITVNSRLLDGSSTLQLAQQKGDHAICRLLVEAGAEAVIQNNESEEENDKSNRSLPVQGQNVTIPNLKVQHKNQLNYTSETPIKSEDTSNQSKESAPIHTDTLRGTGKEVSEGRSMAEPKAREARRVTTQERCSGGGALCGAAI